MRIGAIASATVAGLVLLCLGCPAVEDSRGDALDVDSRDDALERDSPDDALVEDSRDDALDVDSRGDALDVDSRGDASDAIEAADSDLSAAHGFLVAPDTSACEPHVCEVVGDAYSEFKAWHSAHACEPAPQDLLCRLKSQQQGVDWPDKAREKIEAASVLAGGFSDAQKAALRCLSFMEPSGEFNVQGGYAGSGSPSGLRLGLELELPGDADVVATGFLDRLGPYIGAAYGVTPDFGLETKVTSYAGYPGASGAVNIRVIATTYKGIRLRDGAHFEVTLQPVSDIGSGQTQPCAGRYRTDDGAGGFFDRRLADVRIDEAGRVPLETAVQGALASCGATCWALADPKAETYLTGLRLVLQLSLGCPSHCKAYPHWTCTYTVDAFTGDVLGGGEDCCVDCWDEA